MAVFGLEPGELPLRGGLQAGAWGGAGAERPAKGKEQQAGRPLLQDPVSKNQIRPLTQSSSATRVVAALVSEGLVASGRWFLAGGQQN